MTPKKIKYKDGGSFRDPDGFVFYDAGKVNRQVNTSYKANYDKLMSSGLYEDLTRKKLLIDHKEMPGDSDSSYRIIVPKKIIYISYPYEWSFSALKDAALLTLKIQKIALSYGMSLKDASSYNFQFLDGKPIFIDTLSFEIYDESPWVAYRQFCRHFLGPLALMSYVDPRLGKMSRTSIDGTQLDIISKILPLQTYLNPYLLIHIHLHARAIKKYANYYGSYKKLSGINLSKWGMIALISNLESAIRNIKLPHQNTEWGNYYEITNYSPVAMESKRAIVAGYAKKCNPKMVWDLGANDGRFSRIFSDQNICTLAFDIDPIAVEKNYLDVKARADKFLLPLWQDLTNPSPDLGWNLFERKSLLNRGKPDLVLALALLHHLVIGNNIPLNEVAVFFKKICKKNLIIEFVPKEDSQVQKLLATRKDIFDSYNNLAFEEIFGRYFKIKHKKIVIDSKRTVYFMEK